MALSDFDIESLADRFEAWGYPRANAGRLLRRYYNVGGDAIDASLVSPRLAQRLTDEIGLRSTQVVARREAADGTVKLLVRSALGGSVECVLMPSRLPDRAAGCVSSQIGCAM